MSVSFFFFFFFAPNSKAPVGGPSVCLSPVILVRVVGDARPSDATANRGQPAARSSAGRNSLMVHVFNFWPSFIPCTSPGPVPRGCSSRHQPLSALQPPDAPPGTSLAFSPQSAPCTSMSLPPGDGPANPFPALLMSGQKKGVGGVSARGRVYFVC